MADLSLHEDCRAHARSFGMMTFVLLPEIKHAFPAICVFVLIFAGIVDGILMLALNSAGTQGSSLGM
jgi:hypothetical protein